MPEKSWLLSLFCVGRNNFGTCTNLTPFPTFRQQHSLSLSLYVQHILVPEQMFNFKVQKFMLPKLPLSKKTEKFHRKMERRKLFHLPGLTTLCEIINCVVKNA